MAQVFTNHESYDGPVYFTKPFLTLPLNVEKVKTVREALKVLVSKNSLEGLHENYQGFGFWYCRIVVSSETQSPREKQYKLFAVVYHEGKNANIGHYVTDAFHVGYNCWKRYDDSLVKTMQEKDVLKPQETRIPHLLFYRKSDMIRTK
ncbi:ubiquitin carboxyl-terminal hydrolase 10-like [Leptinotarsa decemlineata]|uniref:ubiquitin carboxyl-terminal hydrolase 10-like n=1 Tax=Leptinotarsa decemlineata TaxID=7539 RepID=UPI003D3062C2